MIGLLISAVLYGLLSCCSLSAKVGEDHDAPPRQTEITDDNTRELALAVNEKRPDQEKPDLALLKAIAAKNVKRVGELLEQGANPNATGESLTRGDSRTVLMIAVFGGNVKIVQDLIKHGAVVNFDEEMREKFQPILMYSDTLAMTKMLVENGAEVDARTGSKMTAMMGAASGGQTKIVQYLLEKRADPNARDEDGNTALMLVANSRYMSAENARIIQTLLAAGADASLKNKNGETALSLAQSWSGNERIINLLQKTATPIQENR